MNFPSYLIGQAKFAFTRFFIYFFPSFWRSFFAAKGAKAKFNCWLDWPEK